MVCKKCCKIIPNEMVECKYCGHRNGTSIYARKEPLFYDKRDNESSIIGNSSLNVNSATVEVSKEDERKNHLKDIVFKILKVAAVVIVVLLVVFGANLVDYIQASKNPVAFSQAVRDGDPVWVVIVDIDGPSYLISKSYNGYGGGFVLGTPSDESQVLCRCTTEDGERFWLLLKYQQYKLFFDGKEFGEGCKLFGRVEDASDLADRPNNDIKGQKVFKFGSLEEQ